MKAPVRKHPIREPIELRTNMKEIFAIVAPTRSLQVKIEKEDTTESDIPKVQKSWPSHGVVDTKGEKCIQEKNGSYKKWPGVFFTFALLLNFYSFCHFLPHYRRDSWLGQKCVGLFLLDIIISKCHLNL